MTEPTLVYDDDCGFCTWWADYVDRHGELRLVGFSDLSAEPELHGRLPTHYEQCSHLVTDDAVYSCGASIEEALRRTTANNTVRDVIEFGRHFEEYERVREWAYRQVANNRETWGQLVSKTPPARQDAADDGSR